MKMKRHLRSAFSWQPYTNIRANLGILLKKVIFLREGGPTQAWFRAAFHFGRYVESLQRSQGWRGVVVHLKGCHVLLQQVAGGQVLDNPRRLGCAIRRSRQGVPSVIPVVHRQLILRGDTWTVKIWSSFFWLYRVLDIPGRLKIKTITAPFTVNYLVIMEWCRWLVLFLPVFLEKIGLREAAASIVSKRRSTFSESETSLLFTLISRNIDLIEYLTALLLPHRESDLCKKLPRKEWKNLQTPILTNLQPRPLLLLNSGPNSVKGPDESPGPGTRTSSGSILTDLHLWMVSPNLFASLRKLWPQAAAFAQTLIVRAKDVLEQITNMGMLDERELSRESTFRQTGEGVWRSDPLLGLSYPRGLGKLGFITEAAGKIRVVAMVDSLTQMLLRPLHDAVFDILRKISQDGTFDQYAPAKKLAAALAGVRSVTIYSYDLSSATDRFPVSLQQALLSYLIGPRVARHWREILVSRDYNVPGVIPAKQSPGTKGNSGGKRKGGTRVPPFTPKSVRYATGQPMGAYTSWAVFALSHHFLVQFAAYQAYGTLKWFELYCLLGDDVVIADDNVAEKYLLLLRAIGVEVGLAKSLISRRRVFEFAKRTFRVTNEGVLVDISGVSLAEISAAITDSSVMESLLQRINVKSIREGIRVASRVLGYGFKVRSSLGGDLETWNPRLVGLLALLSRPSSVWGLDPLTWLTQVTAGVRGLLSDEHLMVIMDAMQQRLIDSAKKFAENRLDLLRSLDVTNVLDENPSQVPGKPWFLRDIPSPLLAEFLREFVVQPMMEQVTRDVRELLIDLDVMANSNTFEGNFSLNEIYYAINRIIDGLSSVNGNVSLFMRRDTHKSDARRESRRRSRLVRFWKASRVVILRYLDKTR